MESREAPAPDPRPAAGSHSGRLLLRMPSMLHANLARAAEREGVSLNQLIVGLLSRSLDNGADGTHGAAPAHVPTREPRLLRVAIVANLVVLVIAGAIAVGLLAVALSDRL